MRLRSKARPRPGGKRAPLRKRSLPQGLPSPTHPLEDLYEAQGLQQHTNVHLQAKHPGRHQSSLQQPQTPSPGPPAPRLPLLEPVALLHPTPPIMSHWRQPHPVTSYWDGPAPITSYWDGPAPCYVTLGSISLKLEGKFSCVGWLLPPWRPLSPGGASCLGKQYRKSHRKEQLRPFCEIGQQWQCQEAEGGVLS